MFKLLWLFLLFIIFCPFSLCLQKQISEEEKEAIKLYLKQLENLEDKSSWIDPHDIFRVDSNSVISSGSIKKEDNLLKPQKRNLPTSKNEFSKRRSSRRIFTGVDEELIKFNEEQNETKQQDDSNVEKESTLKASRLSENKIIIKNFNEFKSKPILNQNNFIDVPKSNKNPSTSMTYLTLWLKMFLNTFPNEELGDERLIISIPIKNIELKEMYSLLSLKIFNFTDVDAILSKLFSNVVINKERSSYIKIGMNYWKYIFLITTILGIMILGMYVHPKITFFMLFIFICTAWQWMQLYQIAISKKHAELESMSFPAACERSKLSAIETFKLWMTDFMVSHGTCEDYYKAIMVDPFWEVTPSMALSAVISKFFLYPLEFFAETVNNSLTKLCKNLSPFHLIFIMVILFIVSLMVFKYRIKSPFFLTFEPATQISTNQNKEIATKIKTNIKRLFVKNEDFSKETAVTVSKEENLRKRILFQTVKCRHECSLDYNLLPDGLLNSHQICSSNNEIAAMKISHLNVDKDDQNSKVLTNQNVEHNSQDILINKISHLHLNDNVEAEESSNNKAQCSQHSLSSDLALLTLNDDNFLNSENTKETELYDCNDLKSSIVPPQKSEKLPPCLSASQISCNNQAQLESKHLISDTIQKTSI